jgi:ubiquinone/menaquinone biosynthesis C-methylase UbiE
MEKLTRYTRGIYDRHAEAYHASIEKGRFYNKYIELPGVKKIIGCVKGKKVLDLGCGTGVHSAHFLSKGATVTGADISGEMLKIATKKHPAAEFVLADMKKLPFVDSCFDIVFSGLAIHYVKDIKAVFREANRVLKPEGRLVVSTMNPVITKSRLTELNGRKRFVLHDYFGIATEKWEMLPGMRIVNYTRTLAELFNPLAEAGFALARITEPRPIASAAKVDPDRYKLTTTTPSFIIFEAKKIRPA